MFWRALQDGSKVLRDEKIDDPSIFEKFQLLAPTCNQSQFDGLSLDFLPKVYHS